MQPCKETKPISPEDLDNTIFPEIIPEDEEIIRI